MLGAGTFPLPPDVTTRPHPQLPQSPAFCDHLAGRWAQEKQAQLYSGTDIQFCDRVTHNRYQKYTYQDKIQQGPHIYNLFPLRECGSSSAVKQLEA